MFVSVVTVSPWQRSSLSFLPWQSQTHRDHTCQRKDSCHLPTSHLPSTYQPPAGSEMARDSWFLMCGGGLEIPSSSPPYQLLSPSWPSGTRKMAPSRMLPHDSQVQKMPSLALLKQMLPRRKQWATGDGREGAKRKAAHVFALQEHYCRG